MLGMVWVVRRITTQTHWAGGHWTRAAFTRLLNAQVEGHPFRFSPLTPFASFSLHLLNLAQKRIHLTTCTFSGWRCTGITSVTREGESCSPVFMKVIFYLFISVYCQLDRKTDKIKYIERREAIMYYDITLSHIHENIVAMKSNTYYLY
jgi:hypothetical protein